MFTHHRLSPTNKLDCPHAMGTNAFSPQRAESFRHLLLLPSPPVAYYRLKPANLRISLGAGAAQFQASPLRVRSHAGACSPPAQRTTTGGCPFKPGFGLSGDVHQPKPQQDTLADALKLRRLAGRLSPLGAGLPLVLIFLALSPKTAAPLFLDFGKGGDIKCFPREILELLTQGAVGKKKSTNSWPQAPTL